MNPQLYMTFLPLLLQAIILHTSSHLAGVLNSESTEIWGWLRPVAAVEEQTRIFSE